MEVTAQLCGRTVFLNGEAVECQVTFHNRLQWSASGKSSKTKPHIYKLAWASAQIHCLCSVSDSRIILPKSYQLASTADVHAVNTDTSFVPSKGERGISILSTSPSILFCDLTIMPDESCTFIYRDTIPVHAPPSFRGSAVKYAYKITIGISIFGRATQLVRLPIRVLHAPGLSEIGLCPENAEESRPSNPFEAREEKKTNVLDIAMEVLETLTTRRGPSYFNIANSDGQVMRFCLLKQAFKIGDDIIGTCDFTESTVKCAEFTVTLQSEEVIQDECLRPGAQASTISSYGAIHQFCLCMSNCNFTMPIPLTVSADFMTDVVTHKWRLHFEFSTVRKGYELGSESPVLEGVVYQAPAVVPVETMIWDLPIKVYATNPLYVSSVSLLKMDTSCIL